jgi:uncharacterized protein HemX
MSEDVFLQVDNKYPNSGKIVVGLTISAALSLGAAGIMIGQFGNRVTTLERDMSTHAPATEVTLGFDNIKFQMQQMQIQMAEIQSTLRASRFTQEK